jgi:hypothetical protein
MNDSVGDLRRIIQDSRAREALKTFAVMSEEAEYENDIKGFYDKVAAAFQEVSRGFVAEGLKMERLERDFEPGFYVQDRAGTRFIFWIEMDFRRPRHAVARALRKADSSPVAARVATQKFCSKEPGDLRDVSQSDIVGAIVYSYEKSFFGQ